MHKIIIVTGSRDWDKNYVINDALAMAEADKIVQGGAGGADRIAHQWAVMNFAESITVNAEWDKFGKAAGHLRNERMLKLYPQAEVYAFLKDASRGTLNCIHKAKELGMKVTIFHYEDV